MSVDGMHIKLTYKGATFEVKNAEELKEVLAQLGLSADDMPAAAPAQQMPGAGRAGDLFVLLSELERAPKGLTATRVAKIARLKGPRGLAGCARAWAKLLGSLGFAQEEAILKTRRGRNYYWLPGPRIHDAIEELTRARIEGRV